ncbi:MAG TPA: ATP-binding protein, partial [Acidimicrobiales bacterium]|nr:ATP-binding protein [Acidimicrobiales bacterium]
AVSFSLVRNAAADTSRKLVLQQDEALARTATNLARSTHNKSQVFSELLPLVSSVPGIKEASIVEVSRDGAFVSAVPKLDVSRHAVALATLGKDRETSGVDQKTAFALVPLFTVPKGAPDGKELIVALFMSRPVSTSAASVSYFLLAGAISLVAAALAAFLISRRISSRVVQAAGAAAQIASGDLSTRLAPSRYDDAELSVLAQALNSMAARLEDLRDLDRQFLLAVSHDLRTPLTSIRGYAEAIAEGQVKEPPRAAAVIVSEANRLERLIGDLLDLARLDAHQFSLSLDEINASETVTAAAESLRYGFENLGIALEIDADDEAPIVADRDRLAQVVANLVENALRFASSRVVVTCQSTDQSTVVVTVTDDGPGIAEHDRPRIFERHFSSSTRPGRSAGTGLGLAIVAELVEAMGGRVTVTSPVDDGSGTSFSVSLPSGRPQRPGRAVPLRAVQRKR